VIYFSTDDYEDDVKRFLGVYFDQYKEFPVLSFKGQKKDEARVHVKRAFHDAIGRLKGILRDDRYDRMIINNLVYFFSKYSYEDVVSMIEFLSDVCKENDSVSVLLMTKGMVDDKQETALKHYCDGVVELSLRETENEIQRRLKFLKLEGVVVPRIVLRYDITNRGIRMESTIRVL
jgi:KaiC/GvpD/RAD55 family RecA-like ATPase